MSISGRMVHLSQSRASRPRSALKSSPRSTIFGAFPNKSSSIPGSCYPSRQIEADDPAPEPPPSPLAMRKLKEDD